MGRGYWNETGIRDVWTTLHQNGGMLMFCGACGALVEELPGGTKSVFTV